MSNNYAITPEQIIENESANIYKKLGIGDNPIKIEQLLNIQGMIKSNLMLIDSCMKDSRIVPIITRMPNGKLSVVQISSAQDYTIQ